MQPRYVVWIAAMAASSLAALPALSQTPTPKPKAAQTYTPPKTPWGDPDLQGLWPSDEMIGVPMQRPKEFGTRAVLTDEEFAARQQRDERTAKADTEEYLSKDFKPGINPPAYWLERGKASRIASLVIDPPDGRIPPLTAEGQKRADELAAYRKGRGVADSWTDQSLYDRCITRGVTGSILPVIYNNGNQILQMPGYVVIRYEMIHEARVIPLDGRPHVGSDIHMYMGDPRGHWEGNTLVVETTNFTDKTSIGLNGNGLPDSESLKLTERFTRVSPNTIDYRVTVDDPHTWTHPWTMAFPLKLEPDHALYEYACHEGNYAMLGMLKGARKEEEEKKEGAKP